MKKMNLVFASLIAIPLFMSCQANNNQVSKKEFYEAVGFENVEYMQVTRVDLNETRMYSPTVYYHDFLADQPDNAREYYVIEKDEYTHIAQWRKGKTGEWKTDYVDSDVFKTPDSNENITGLLQSFNAVYTNFEFINGEYRFNYLDLLTIAIKFENKLVISFNIIGKDSSYQYLTTYKYEHKEIAYPVPIE